MDAVRTQGIDRHRGDEGRIDAAGKAEHHAGEAVLLDIVAQAEHAGSVVGLVALLDGGDGAGLAIATRRLAPPGRGDAHASSKAGSCSASERSAFEREGSAVEDHLVLPADLVGVERAAGPDSVTRATAMLRRTSDLSR